MELRPGRKRLSVHFPPDKRGLRGGCGGKSYETSEFRRRKPLLSGRAAFAQAARSAGAAQCAANSPLHPLVRGGTQATMLHAS